MHVYIKIEWKSGAEKCNIENEKNQWMRLTTDEELGKNWSLSSRNYSKYGSENKKMQNKKQTNKKFPEPHPPVKQKQ